MAQESHPAPRRASGCRRPRLGALDRARLEVLRDELYVAGGVLGVESDSAARKFWGERGMSLHERDQAVDRLVKAGLAFLEAGVGGILLYAIAALEEPTARDEFFDQEDAA